MKANQHHDKNKFFSPTETHSNRSINAHRWESWSTNHRIEKSPRKRRILSQKSEPLRITPRNIPSGKLTVCSWKLPLVVYFPGFFVCLPEGNSHKLETPLWKPWKLHEIAMFNDITMAYTSEGRNVYQRVNPIKSHHISLNIMKSHSCPLDWDPHKSHFSSQIFPLTFPIRPCRAQGTWSPARRRAALRPPRWAPWAPPVRKPRPRIKRLKGVAQTIGKP